MITIWWGNGNYWKWKCRPTETKYKIHLIHSFLLNPLQRQNKTWSFQVQIDTCLWMLIPHEGFTHICRGGSRKSFKSLIKFMIHEKPGKPQNFSLTPPPPPFHWKTFSPFPLEIYWGENFYYPRIFWHFLPSDNVWETV